MTFVGSNSIFFYLALDKTIFPLFYRFIIKNYVTEKYFELDLNISLCFEDRKDCVLIITVLEKSKLPKVFCNWGTGYYKPGMLYIYLAIP